MTPGPGTRPRRIGPPRLLDGVVEEAKQPRRGQDLGIPAVESCDLGQVELGDERQRHAPGPRPGPRRAAGRAGRQAWSSQPGVRPAQLVRCATAPRALSTPPGPRRAGQARRPPVARGGRAQHSSCDLVSPDPRQPAVLPLGSVARGLRPGRLSGPRSDPAVVAQPGAGQHGEGVDRSDSRSQRWRPSRLEETRSARWWSRACRRGPSQASSAADPLGCAPWAGRPAAPRTRRRRWCWPPRPTATAAAHRRQRPGAASTRAWPGRPGLRLPGPPGRSDLRYTSSTMSRSPS
jgi:hypothetical protein